MKLNFPVIIASALIAGKAAAAPIKCTVEKAEKGLCDMPSVLNPTTTSDIATFTKKRNYNQPSVMPCHDSHPVKKA